MRLCSERVYLAKTMWYGFSLHKKYPLLSTHIFKLKYLIPFQFMKLFESDTFSVAFRIPLTNINTTRLVQAVFDI